MSWCEARVLICILSGPLPVALIGLIADTLSVFSAASTSLLSSLYSVLRSVVTVALLYGFCYGALKVRAKTAKKMHLANLSQFEIRGSQHLHTDCDKSKLSDVI